jgi:glycosyltransferase involved in cell wall biosynthesis
MTQSAAMTDLSANPTLPHARRTRVLYVDHTAMLGGGEIALVNLVEQIDKTRFDPQVVLFADGPLVERLHAVGVEVTVLPISASVNNARKGTLGVGSLLKLKAIYHALKHVVRVRRLIRNGRFQVVHTNSLKADLIGGLAGRLAGAKVIWHVRDRIADDYLPGPVAKMFRVLARVVPHHLIANSQATLDTVDRSVRQSVVFSGVKVGTRLSVVHDGTHALTPHVGAETIEAAFAHRRVGVVGRLSPWKGQHIFLQAAAKVAPQFPDVRFDIIGAALFDEQEYEASLHRLVDDLGLRDVVTFSGFRNDVPAVMRSLDVMTHASTVGEPFGQVIIEAMTAGKPVIATDGGGVPEIVLDGVTGILVPMGDVKAMAQAMSRLLSDPAAALEMGRRGRERVAAHFDIKLTARKVMSIYDQLSGSSAEARA